MTQNSQGHSSQDDDRRNVGRLRSLLGARIITNNCCSIIDCSIRNKSDTGCQLVVHSQLGIPDSFELIQNNTGASYKCQVVWRKVDRIGVKFI